jgi:heterodisulfide reductase subunit A
VDVAKVAEAASRFPGVVYATHYEYMCSDPGQALIQRAIKEHRLNGIVVAACSPTMHEETFRRAASAAGLNPYLVEIANIREQVSWVHEGPKATEKAIRVARAMVEKVRANQPLTPAEIGVTRRALVIGGGIAGIQAALDIANAGFEVLLVEKSPSIGGHMAQLSETFPTLDCSQCILTPKMVEVSRHPQNPSPYVLGSGGSFRFRGQLPRADPKKADLRESRKVQPLWGVRESLSGAGSQ